MKISKTRFINMMRCDRFPALFEIYKSEKGNSIVTFKDDMSDLYDEENAQKKNTLFESMYTYSDTTEELDDLLDEPDPSFEIMKPYFNQMEQLTARTIKNRFGGYIEHAIDTKDQKYFEFEQDGFYFYAFLDAYQEDDHTIRIIESKATTSSKFLKMTYNVKRKVNETIFVKSPEGILRFRHELGFTVGDKYSKVIKKFEDRFDDLGKYFYDIAYQRYVIEKNNHTQKPIKYYLSILNREYVFDGTYESYGNPIYDDDIIQLIDVTEFTKKMLPQLALDFERVINRLNTMYASRVPVGKFCQRNKRTECIFFDICHKEIMPEKRSMFEYRSNDKSFKDPNKGDHYLYDLINNGVVHMLDIDYTYLNRKSNQIQYQCVSSQDEYMDKEKIRKAIESLQYPLYHLDFETFPCPLPRFKGERPYDQSTFQFSLHIEHKPGELKSINQNHHEYLATTHQDEREELVIKLVNLIGDKGHVIAYNYGFEKGRMKELAKMFPKYREKLMNIVDRTFDLMHLFKGNETLYKSLGYSKEELTLMYYHENLAGSYSIKKVLPIFAPELSYDHLDLIHHGGEAMVGYAKLPHMAKSDFDAYKKAMLEYCKQDTWAMVILLNKLISKANE